MTDKKKTRPKKPTMAEKNYEISDLTQENRKLSKALETATDSLQKACDELEGVKEASDIHKRSVTHWQTSFGREKDDHRETHSHLRVMEAEKQSTQNELDTLKQTVAQLMVQNVRLQGRLEGALVVTGHLHLKDVTLARKEDA